MKKTFHGFTLVELIVSVALFTIVVTITTSAYLSLISLNRKARATNDVVTNLSFVVENMTRSMRTGTQYSCNGGTNCWPNGATSFTFKDENNQQITFRLNSNRTIGECIGTGVCNDSTASGITDPRVTVTNMVFYTQGVGNPGIGTGDGVQPRVLFTITGSITPDVNTAPITFTIESSATERLIEI